MSRPKLQDWMTDLGIQDNPVHEEVGHGLKNESGDVLFATCLELAFVAAFGSLTAIYFNMIYDSI